ncbi:MFS transporter [Knoellia koreensis]|uniref:MFS transporter n=1 Tax=Knoellia koreensis TaxID=2730921 RepID=A0A849HLC8_9MICO|nr:MFS transporter [Knoellia sp. DB2414S]
MSAPTSPRPSLHDRHHLPFAIGAVALVTLGAFENRAVTTVLPTVARELDGLWLFGAASAAPLVTFVVATTVAGLWADRSGPTRVLYAGMAVFVAAELLMGLAPSMVPFVGGRLLGGFAEGLFDVGLTVLVARALPAVLRPKMFATFAAAWVLPSLLGPSVAGFVAEQWHWRLVFLLGVALLLPVALFLRPAMTRSAATHAVPTPDEAQRLRARRTTGWALVAATGLAAVTAGGSLLTREGWLQVTGGALLVAGATLLVPALRVVLPAGTLTGAPGIPALTALRGLLGAAFGTAGGLLPLLLTELRGYGPTAAGVSLTITGVFWAAGSQLQGLRAVQARASVVGLLRSGFALITAGLVGPVLLALDAVPVWLGLAGWAVAATGIGITSPTISTHVLTLSTEADQGRNSAASFLAPSVTQALAFAASGAAIAWQAPHLTGGLFAVVMAACVVMAAAALALSPRAR